MITKFGKRFLANFIAGNSSFSSKEMALGIATGTEYALANTNSRLDGWKNPANLSSRAC